MKSAIVLFAVLLCCVAAAEERSVSVEGNRIALVIGNGNYQYPDSLPRLANPTNDAADIANALRGFGFEVIEKEDLGLQGMNDAITEFSRRIGTAEASLFYFAGHGIQVKGQNYLIPVDANITTEAGVQYASVNVNWILDEMDNADTAANIVILDACRNNPISGKFRSGATRGLAAPASTPRGTVIVYATDPGNVASDGAGRNGLFTAGLLTAFQGSDLSLFAVLVQASKEVESASDHAQTPYVNGPPTLQQSFRFRRGVPLAVPASVPVPVGSGVSLEDLKRQQEVREQWDRWQAAMRSDFDQVGALAVAPDLEVAAWERFLASYGQDNPLSADDDQLRAQAQTRKQGAETRQREVSALLEQKRQQTQVQAGQAQQVASLVTPGGGAISSTGRACEACPEMVLIPAGHFRMGDMDGSGTRYEKPVHEVTVEAFALGKFEVTFAEYEVFARATGRALPDDGGWGWGNRPVTNVTWDDAQAYAKWLAQSTGFRFRLPSEAEWEYAARAGTVTRYSWGDEVGRNQANCVGCGSPWDARQTAPVGSFAANAFGLYDMHGNVYEWVEDCYHKNYKGAPTSGAAWTSGCEQIRGEDYRILRGGAWGYEPGLLRSAGRMMFPPTARWNQFGFRVAQDL